MKLDSKEQAIWFTSDTHYWHKNITYGVSVWGNKETACRRFNTTEEMSRHIVKKINEVVAENDILFHLGDWSFGGINNIWNFRKQLRCKNVHLIYGNHDHHIINYKILPNCILSKQSFEIMSEGLEHKDYIIDGSYEDIKSYDVPFQYEVDSKMLFSSTQQYLEVQIDGVNVILFHYPIESWNDRHKASYHLFGHVHGNIPHGGGRIDVGMDYAYKVLKEYRPFSWNEIKKLLGQPKKYDNNHGI